MRIFVTALLVVSSLAGLAFPQTPKVQAGDLRRLTGTQWTGSLTYKEVRYKDTAAFFERSRYS